MTPENSIYRFRLRTLALAEELGNVRAACQAMGIHYSTFYRWKQQAKQYGLELLRTQCGQAMPSGQNWSMNQASVAAGNIR